MEKVRLGIIGIGNMGTNHAKSIVEGRAPEVELTAVADRRESRRTWCRENLPENVAVFEQAKDLMASGLCDAVLLSIPHYQHPELSIAEIGRAHV